MTVDTFVKMGVTAIILTCFIVIFGVIDIEMIMYDADSMLENIDDSLSQIQSQTDD